MKKMVGRKYTDYELSDIDCYFTMPLSQAAHMMKISVTMLKKICRRLGIARWPFREMKKLDQVGVDYARMKPFFGHFSIFKNDIDKEESPTPCRHSSSPVSSSLTHPYQRPAPVMKPTRRTQSKSSHQTNRNNKVAENYNNNNSSNNNNNDCNGNNNNKNSRSNNSNISIAASNTQEISSLQPSFELLENPSTAIQTSTSTIASSQQSPSDASSSVWNTVVHSQLFTFSQPEYNFLFQVEDLECIQKNIKSYIQANNNNNNYNNTHYNNHYGCNYCKGSSSNNNNNDKCKLCFGDNSNNDHYTTNSSFLPIDMSFLSHWSCDTES